MAFFAFAASIRFTLAINCPPLFYFWALSSVIRFNSSPLTFDSNIIIAFIDPQFINHFQNSVSK
jgi:hypothetical protein